MPFLEKVLGLVTRLLTMWRSVLKYNITTWYKTGEDAAGSRWRKRLLNLMEMCIKMRFILRMSVFKDLGQKLPAVKNYVAELSGTNFVLIKLL